MWITSNAYRAIQCLALRWVITASKHLEVCGWGLNTMCSDQVPSNIKFIMFLIFLSFSCNIFVRQSMVFLLFPKGL